MFDVVIKYENFEGQKLIARMTIETTNGSPSMSCIRDMALKRLYEVAAVAKILIMKIHAVKFYNGDDVHTSFYYKNIEFTVDYNLIGDIKIGECND